MITLPALALLAVLGAPRHSSPAVRTSTPIWTSALALSRQMPLEQRRPGPVQSSRAHAGLGMNPIVLGALIGAAAGGAIGYVMTNNCKCDEPGYGVVLGIPLGAVGGAVLGAVIR